MMPCIINTYNNALGKKTLSLTLYTVLNPEIYIQKTNLTPTLKKNSKQWHFETIRKQKTDNEAVKWTGCGYNKYVSGKYNFTIENLIYHQCQSLMSWHFDPIFQHFTGSLDSSGSLKVSKCTVWVRCRLILHQRSCRQSFGYCVRPALSHFNMSSLPTK